MNIGGDYLDSRNEESRTIGDKMAIDNDSPLKRLEDKNLD